MYDVVTFGQSTADVYLMSKKFRVIRDKKFITGEAECFAFGTKIELDDVLFEVGGGATNTAVTFARQGLLTGIVSKIGSDDAGESIIATLRRHGVSTHHLVIAEGRRSGYATIFLGHGGERTALVYRGAGSTLTAREIAWTHLRAKWFYISSLGGNIQLLKSILQFARKKRIRVALNPGALELKKGGHQLKKLLRKVDILLVNREEAAGLVGVPISHEKKIVHGLDALCDGIAVVTEGDRGSWVADNNVVRKISITPVKAVDTTGAGDAYGSGFVAGLIKRPGDFDYALRLASINSASEVQAVGAKNGLITRRLPRGKKWMRIHVTTYPR